MTGSFFRQTPLGINRRNRFIRDGNPPDLLRRVKNKAEFKGVLEQNGVATPRTYDLVHDFTDMRLITAFPDEFVVKPARGSGGSGIILLQRQNGRFVNPSGDSYSALDVRRHIRKILDGEFSGYIASDLAIIEERLYPSPQIQFKNAYGLPDIRIFCLDFQPVMAMLRYPTFESKGRANLAVGGIGIGIGIAAGRPTYMHTKLRRDEPSFDEVGIPAEFAMPAWEEMKELAVKCSRLAGLRMTGVDLILDDSDRVRVLEVNGRPGIEIQNINEESLLLKIQERSRKRQLTPAHFPT